MASFNNIFLGQFKKKEFVQMGSESNINYFYDIEEGSKTGKLLSPTPGWELRKTVPVGTISRALYNKQNTFLYYVISNRIYQLDSNLTELDITSSIQLNTSAGYVGVDSNQNDQVIFVDGGNAYAYDEGTATFSVLAGVGLPSTPTDVVFFDGRFYIIARDNQIYAGGLNDVTDWSVLRTGDFNTRPDKTVGIRRLGRQIFVMGQQIGEIWQNKGLAGGFPLAKNNSVYIDYGCLSVASIDESDGEIIWLGSRKNGKASVFMSRGANPIEISDKSVDEAIRNLNNYSNAVGNIYRQGNNLFYNLTFPSDNLTLVCNLTNDFSWHLEEDVGGLRHPAQDVADFRNETLFCYYNQNQLYKLSSDIYTSNGANLKRQKITPQIYSEQYKNLRISKLEIDMLFGKAAADLNLFTQRMLLFISFDGGVTYQSRRPISISKIGQYKYRMIWRNLGFGRNITFKIESYNNYPMHILGDNLILEEMKL